MGCSCKNQPVTNPIQRKYPLLKKLGTCKFCMRTSAICTIFSIGLVWFVKTTLLMPYLVDFGLTLMAIGFTTLSLVHLIFFMNYKLKKADNLS